MNIILTFLAGTIIGAAGFALILKNNPKLQKFFNFVVDKVEEEIEKETGKDL